MAENIEKILKNLESGALSQAAAVDMLKALEKSGMKLNLQKDLFANLDSSKIHDNIAKKSADLFSGSQDLNTAVLEDIKTNISTLLKIDYAALDIKQPLIEYGMDSLSINEFIARISKKYNIQISPTVLFEFRNIEEFSSYLVKQYEPELSVFYNYSAKSSGDTKFDEQQNDLLLLKKSADKIDSFVEISKLNSIVISNLNSSVEFFCYGEGDIVLLIGGIGCSALVWEKQLEALLKFKKVLIYYPPAHGKTSLSSENFSFSVISEQLYNALKILNITQPIHLVGWSLGGTIAQQFTINYPDQVKSLTLVATRASGISSPDIFPKLIKEIEELKQKVENKDIAEYFPYYGDALTLYRDTLAQFDFTQQLNCIIAPTLIITGSEDKYIDRVDSQKLAEKIKNSRYIEIENAGHYPFLTHDALFNSHLLKFINNLD